VAEFKNYPIEGIYSRIKPDASAVLVFAFHKFKFNEINYQEFQESILDKLLKSDYNSVDFKKSGSSMYVTLKKGGNSIYVTLTKEEKNNVYLEVFKYINKAIESVFEKIKKNESDNEVDIDSINKKNKLLESENRLLEDKNNKLFKEFTLLKLKYDSIKDNEEERESDDYTKVIGEKSEKYLFEILKDRFPSLRVISLNINGEGHFTESYKNHDFEIINNDGIVINYIDCKGTPNIKRTFYMSENEWEFFLANTDNYQIYRVFNVENNKDVIVIENLMEWITKGKVVPYLEETETINRGRVFLTLKKEAINNSKLIF